MTALLIFACWFLIVWLIVLALYLSLLLVILVPARQRQWRERRRAVRRYR